MLVTLEMKNTLRIADIVDATGLSKSTLIRYESKGVIPAAKKDGRGWRYYSQQDKVSIISKLRKLDLIPTD